MSMFCLSHLPDLCVLSIFEHIPLFDVIRTVGRVCTKWSRLQRSELMRRRTLVLDLRYRNGTYKYFKIPNDTFGSELIEHVRRDDGSPWARPLRSLHQMEIAALPLPTGNLLTEQFTNSVMTILPRITRLSMIQYVNNPSVCPALEQMIRLIDHHATSLVWLKIDFTTFSDSSFQTYLVDDHKKRNHHQTSLLALFDSINRLESLRHLTLNVNHPDIPKYHHKLKLPILSRLNSFTTNELNTNVLTYSMTQYTNQNDQLRLNCRAVLSLERLLLLEPQLATKFVRVHVQNAEIANSNHYESTQQFCVRFNSLVSLKLEKLTMSMIMLARCLSQLTQLIYLEVKHISFLLKDQIASVDKTPQLKIIQVRSVRLLILTIFVESHLDTDRLYLAEIFPALQVLSLCQLFKKCTECNFKIGQVKPSRHHLLLNCLHLSRQPFRRCAKLHSIEHSSWGDFERILPKGLLSVNQW